MLWNKTKKQRRRRARRGPSLSKRPPLDPRAAALEQFVVEEIELDGSVEVARPRERRRFRLAGLADFKLVLAWTGLWLILTAAALFSRWAWPVDELRHLAVAWEMWLGNDWLVPRLNGQVYTHTPPLFFWLTQAGWTLFGVNDWWPRVLPALFGWMSIIFMTAVARQLWPGRADIARYVPFLLLGLGAWSWYAGWLYVDLLLVFFLVVAYWALLIMGRRGRLGAWIMLGTALGLGTLAGGLVMFWYVLPLALLAPVWTASETRIDAGRWYRDVFLALLLGAAMFAAWLVPLYQQLGVEAVRTVLQTYASPHSVSFFQQAQPWWAYLVYLPLVFLPWSLWPLAWMRLWHIRRQRTDRGLLFCIVAGIPVLVFLMLIDTRQVQFLLPVFPAYVLAVAYLLFDDDLAGQGENTVWSGMSFPVIALGGLLAALPQLPRLDFLPAILWEMSPLVGVVLGIIGIGIAWLPAARMEQRLSNISVSSLMLVVFAILIIGWQFNPANDVRPVAQVLARAEQAGRPIAHLGDYQGEYQFAGRLRRPLTVVDKAYLASWARQYPNGLVVTAPGGAPPRLRSGARPVFRAELARGQVLIWNADAFLVSAR